MYERRTPICIIWYVPSRQCSCLWFLSGHYDWRTNLIVTPKLSIWWIPTVWEWFIRQYLSVMIGIFLLVVGLRMILNFVSTDTKFKLQLLLFTWCSPVHNKRKTEVVNINQDRNDILWKITWQRLECFACSILRFFFNQAADFLEILLPLSPFTDNTGSTSPHGLGSFSPSPECTAAAGVWYSAPHSS